MFQSQFLVSLFCSDSSMGNCLINVSAGSFPWAIGNWRPRSEVHSIALLTFFSFPLYFLYLSGLFDEWRFLVGIWKYILNVVLFSFLRNKLNSTKTIFLQNWDIYDFCIVRKEKGVFLAIFVTCCHFFQFHLSHYIRDFILVRLQKL